MTEAEHWHAEYSMYIKVLDKKSAEALTNIRRLAGLDPDGPRVPMQPYLTEHQRLFALLDEGKKHVRDACLVNSLRFTWYLGG